MYVCACVCVRQFVSSLMFACFCAYARGSLHVCAHTQQGASKIIIHSKTVEQKNKEQTKVLIMSIYTCMSCIWHEPTWRTVWWRTVWWCIVVKTTWSGCGSTQRSTHTSWHQINIVKSYQLYVLVIFNWKGTLALRDHDENFLQDPSIDVGCSRCPVLVCMRTLLCAEKQACAEGAQAH